MTRRLYVLFFLFIVALLSITARLFYWQVIAADKLAGLAQMQRTFSEMVPAKRGKIFSDDGSPLVINQRAYLVYAEPPNVQNLQQAISQLSGALRIDASTLSAQLSDKTKQWVPLAHKVDELAVERIKESSLAGIGFFDQSKRFYPEGSMAAHLLGFVGNNAKGEDQGYFGLEGYYDEQLRGRNGLREAETDALGHLILLGNRREIPVENGRDIYLTMDKTIQFIAESKLKEGIEKYQAKGGTVTVMDPKTGAILAMAAFPAYDPGEYFVYPQEYYKNPIIASTYEPGSTFKVLVMAAALEKKAIPVTAKFQEDGPVRLGGYTIQTWDQKYHGAIDLSQILQYSSNVGMVYIQQQMDNDALLDAVTQLGFGASTDIDLQEETYVDLRERDQWREIDFATLSFGQGIAVTPIEMVRAVAALANGGKIMRPYAVKQIITPEGKIVRTQPTVEKEMFSKETTAAVSEMMVAAVEHGEAKYKRPKGFRIAGKTGTAQIPVEGHYDSEKTIASFVGYGPVDDPKFIMLVTIHEPTTSSWGSETAAPLFFVIAKELLSYLGISPTE